MTLRFWAAFFVLATAAATAQVEQLAPGKFMVASRDLGDPNFAQSVILLMRYDDEQGAMGLIVNRRSDVPVSRLLADLKEAKHRSDLVYLGGPVELSSVLALLRSANKPNDSERVIGDVFLISSKALLQKTLLTKYPKIDAAFFHNDDMALAAYNVMKAKGRTDILIGGVDAMPPAIAAVADGRMFATVRNPSSRIHGGAIIAGVAAVAGEKTGAGIPKNIVTDGPVVTKDNAPGMQWMEDHFLI